jgi:hypothetical protein
MTGVYVHVCVCVCVYICTHIHTYTGASKWTSARAHTPKALDIHTYTCMHTQAYQSELQSERTPPMANNIHTYTHTHTQAYQSRLQSERTPPMAPVQVIAERETDRQAQGHG